MSGENEYAIWNHCAADCPGRCPLLFHVKDGRALSVTSNPQARACARGRSMPEWMNSPHRLRYPLKRTGPRGSGCYERISWDEAFDTVASELDRIRNQYGNDALYYAPGTGANSTTSDSFGRLLNCLGGYLGHYNDYSDAQIKTMARYMYGDSVKGSDIEVACDSDLLIAFGASPIETSRGGSNTGQAWKHVCDQVMDGGGRVVIIDPRRNGSIIGNSMTWLPIRPGTDAALAATLAHECYCAGACDTEFLHAWCVGFDEACMPAAYRGRHLSYVDYLMGTGYDAIEKTVVWGSSITGVPAADIEQLASWLCASKRSFVMQGWGSQRRENGEMTAGAIMMLSLIKGQIGMCGTNNGMHENNWGRRLRRLPLGTNHVTARIPCFLFTDAIARGIELTSADGIKGADHLSNTIRGIVNVASNCLTNQHGDVHRSRRILADDSLCEFILGVDVEMTDSMRYADVILPDLFRAEQYSVIDGGATHYHITYGRPVALPPGEQKSAWTMCEQIAERLGVRDEFTEGLNEQQWIRRLYEQDARDNADLPAFDVLRKQCVWHEQCKPRIALSDFRSDPEQHPLSAPSGKIELFSERLYKLKAQRPDGRFEGIPVYVPEENAHGYPFRLTGFHCDTRIHSSWGNVASLNSRTKQAFWMHPADAKALEIENDDMIAVHNERGCIELPVWITDRVVPGCLALSEGAWVSCALRGDDTQVSSSSCVYAPDQGGCINVLTGHVASPIAKANPQNTIFVAVERCAKE